MRIAYAMNATGMDQNMVSKEYKYESTVRTSELHFVSSSAAAAWFAKDFQGRTGIKIFPFCLATSTTY